MCKKRRNRHRKAKIPVAAAHSASAAVGSIAAAPAASKVPPPPSTLHDVDDAEHPAASMPSPAGSSSSEAARVKANMRTINISAHSRLKNCIDQGDIVFKTVDEFVERFIDQPDKRRPIRRVLVATNGIAAVRCMLSIRRLLQHIFNNDRIVKFICITTEQEILSNAEYLKLADHYVTSPGGENRNNYANVDEIVTHAKEQNVDAVWAGWGHASENPELPRQLAKHGIVFIGPSAEAMASLGDKIASTIIAQSVNIPTIEWSGCGLTIEQDGWKSGEAVTVSDELFKKACVFDVQEGLEAMEKHKIGYPMMIKASEGGGGKGIRRCLNEVDFRENFVQVQTEVPGSPIFLMKCLENARHIEVQLIADRYGCVIPIFTRDCSIQRRCQKIIEEAPASIAPKATLKRMQEDAVRLAELVGYESAGTVEYMYLQEEDKYFFLELNPRLQVEHPCTEMLTSINIPATQLQIAMGLPLKRITDIRLFYGLERYGDTDLPEERVLTDTEYSVIAARITSEDPDDFFRPSTGQVIDLNFRSAQNVWGYFSVSSSGKVHEFADSQFGHLFARGRTRHEAISTMLCALKELDLRATFSSQVSYLVDLLNEEDFKLNRFNTQWLDKRIADKVAQRCPYPIPDVVAISSAVIGHNKVTSAFNNFRNAIERGQVLPTKDLTETFLFDLIKDMKIYKVQVTRAGPLSFIVYLNGTTTQVGMRQLGDNSLLVTYKEKCYKCHLEETTDKYKVAIGRSSVTFEKDNDPTILKSPYTGRLLSYKRAHRDLVAVGQVYASIESMKLVFNVEVKKVPGRLEHIAKEGDLLFPGSVIARIVEQKNTEEFRPKPFTGQFPEWTECSNLNSVQNESKKFSQTYEQCINLLNGSIPPDLAGRMDELVADLFQQLECPSLPMAMLKKEMDSSLARIPVDSIQRALAEAAALPGMEKFGRVKDVLLRYFASIQPHEYEAARAITGGINTVCERFANGILSHMCLVVNSLLEEFVHCERFFETDQYTDAVSHLNQEYGSDKDRVVALIYSHTQLKAKNRFMLSLLNAVEKKGMHMVAPLEDNLREIGNLFKTEEVSRKCRHLMLLNSCMKYRKFVNKVVWDVEKVPLKERDTCEVLTVADAVSRLRQLFSSMVNRQLSPKEIFDHSPWAHKVLHEFFFDPVLADAAIRAYIGQHFAVEDVQRSQLAANAQSAIVYDFTIDNSNLTHYMMPGAENNQYLSIVKFSVNYENFLEAATHENIISGLVTKYKALGVKSNGRKSCLRVTFLVNVIDFEEPTEDEGIGRVEEEDAEPEGHSRFREAQLEELPRHSKRESDLVGEADAAASVIRAAISQALQAVEVVANVLVCYKNKPLLQVDLLGAERLELWRLPTGAHPKSEKLSSLRVYQMDDPTERRFSRIFVREILEIPIRDTKNCEDEIGQSILKQMDRACGAINVTMSSKTSETKNVCQRRISVWCSDPDKQQTMSQLSEAVFVGNHLMFSISFPKLDVSFTKENEDTLDELLVNSIREMRPILFKHHVTEVEMVYAKVEKSDVGVRTVVKRRVKYQDKTGVTPEFGVFDEFQKEVRAVKMSHQLYERALEPHHPIKKIEKKRSVTRAIRTTYVYDFPKLFGRACMERWSELYEKQFDLFEKQFARLQPAQREAFARADFRRFYDEAELVYRTLPDGKVELELIEDATTLKRRADNCDNETGVVAWRLRLYTPEKPAGYSVIVIANDITFQSGSFATAEDDVYAMASEYSRKHKLPRVNMSSNSGARIGLAEDVSKVFRVKFKDSSRPEEGFDYLYIEPADEAAVRDQIVAERLPNNTLKLLAVVGKPTEKIGVENLQGSGLIAGETSTAYDEVPTYCFVTGRSVGIGAYTARLAHRIVQARPSHIILTGAAALNTVLGKEVYTSNNQLGGTQIMYNNGVTHAVVDDDAEGVAKLVLWMSYLPDVTPSFPYISSFGVDSAPRPVTYHIEPNKPYDVRELIDTGCSRDHSGICDSGSFDEVMADWAKTIVAGRARIQGMPIGVVASELRNVCSVLPADPATPNSQAIDVHQAGQVWYPDSAFKTAEVIGDFNREGLPLLFFASLRGFSGGQKDMFEMVLKFGAQIVDALRQYKQPVIIYIPTHGELRGGAWAVLDSKINPGFITMIADSKARGGILEPSAIVGIKFRADKLLALQKRNDEILNGLDRELTEEIREHGQKSVNAERLASLIKKRSDELKKAYRGVTVELADLHDRPERMRIRNAVQHVVKLRESRNLFADIFRLESAKIHIANRYMSVERSATPQSAMRFVREQLEAMTSSASSSTPSPSSVPPSASSPALSTLVPEVPPPPSDQFALLEKCVRDGVVDHWLAVVKEQSVERDLEQMTEEEMLLWKRRFDAVAKRRKFSLQ